jgi:hypothetical protein
MHVARTMTRISLSVIALAVLPTTAGAGDIGRCGTRHIIAPTKRVVRGRPPLAVGDSVLLGAVDEVAAKGYEVDVRGCRGMDETLDVLRSRARNDRLPSYVVVYAGTNFDVRNGQVDEALRILGPARVLGLMTPRELGGGSGQDAVVVRDQERRHPGRVVVIDWVRYSAGHGGWFAGDGIHLNPSGARGYARLLAATLRQVELRGRKARERHPAINVSRPATGRGLRARAGSSRAGPAQTPGRQPGLRGRRRPATWSA